MANRLPQIRQRLADFDAEALLISSLPNIRWACGFTGSNGLLLVSRRKAVFVTDGRYTDQAQDEVEGAEVVIADNGLVSRLVDLGFLDDLSQVLFQADHVTVSKQTALRKHLSDIEWMGESQLLANDIASKESAEVDQIRRAQNLTESVFEEVISLVEPGMTEKEVAAEITYRHLKRGADKMSFDPIVASGPNGAYPHAPPTDRQLREGELIVLDMGCFLDGYASDMTRTVSLGHPPSAAQRGYEVVQAAQEKALDVARAGLTGKKLDSAARTVIEGAGLGDYFSHGLGHGIGLQVHEWPRVSKTEENELTEGACVTIEPGVYVPEQEYGVRIEDIVVLNTNSCENLTSTSKELRIL